MRTAHPLEALDKFGHRFLEPQVADYLCSTLRDTFHRGALKTRYLEQLMRSVRGAMPVGLETAAPLARSLAEAMLTQCLPTQKGLCNIVLKVFQLV